jgi:hypothetical protein
MPKSTLRCFLLASAIAFALAACTETKGQDRPSGLSLPAGCRAVDAASTGAKQSWTLSCEDSEHILTADEARPLFDQALQEGGWEICGVAGGSTYFIKGGEVTVLAFAQNDRRDPHFGEVYLSQKSQSDECVVERTGRVIAFEPEGYVEVAANTDTGGGTPVYIFDDQTVGVYARTENVAAVRIRVTMGDQALSEVSGQPDPNGELHLFLPLPEPDVAYLIQGTATSSLHPTDEIPLEGFRVMHRRQETEGSASPEPGELTYRSNDLGFQIVLPATPDNPEALNCRPSSGVSKDEVNLGSNILIRVSESNGQSAAKAAASFLATIGARSDSNSPLVVDGIDGVREDYRLVPSGRFGTAVFVVKGTRLYLLLFEARDMTQCGGLATPALFDALVSGFKFLS